MPNSSIERSELIVSPAPALLVSLIECATALLDTDRKASRECLRQAYALLRTHPDGHGVAIDTNTRRGRLATWQAKRVIAYINDHLAERILTKELAELVNLSTSHFFRAFRISIGLSPCDYIARRRIEAARERMRLTMEPISQIALAIGFAEQSSFCRTFRRIVGQTPIEWRRENAAAPTRGGQTWSSHRSMSL
jgi:AraC family transcriptional regulator